MEIESLHKYINLNKLANGTTEVMFAGQPCLSISEATGSNVWKINPVFAKLVYGANIFEDIPVCTEDYSSVEEAVAGGLVKLHELGAFNTEIDIPEDTYAATMNQVQEEVKSYSIKNSKNIMEASKLYSKVMTSISEGTFDKYNKFVPVVVEKPVEVFVEVTEEIKVPVTGLFKAWRESKLNEVFNSDDYYLVDKDKKKIVRNLGTKRISPSFNSAPHKAPELAQYIEKEGHTVMSGHQLNRGGYTNEEVVSEDSDADHEKWKSDVQKAHPGVKMKFKGYIEDGKDNISAEDETGRTHGVWDNDKNKGHIFKLEEDVLDEKTLTTAEMEKREEIVKAIKRDPKFQTKKGKSSAYAIATARAKELV